MDKGMIDMPTGLENKKIVITGSTRGLGRVLALNFLRRNATLILNYSNDDQTAREMENIVSKISDVKAYLFKADVSDPNQVKFFGKLVQNTIGTPDVLINNAGIAESSHFFSMTYEQWKKVIDVNLNGVFHCTQIFARKMAKLKMGKIINIGSLTGETGLGGNCNYAAAKSGLIGLTRSLARDLKPFNILINLVYPPTIPTHLNQRVSGEILSASYHNDDIGNSSSLEAFINFVTYMCSDNFHTISGQVFCLNNKNWEGE
jgi:3-oxoacyl-[acyl-carrier protein] reductase